MLGRIICSDAGTRSSMLAANGIGLPTVKTRLAGSGTQDAPEKSPDVPPLIVDRTCTGAVELRSRLGRNSVSLSPGSMAVVAVKCTQLTSLNLSFCDEITDAAVAPVRGYGLYLVNLIQNSLQS